MRTHGADSFGPLAHGVGELGCLHHPGNDEWDTLLATWKLGLGQDMPGCGLLEFTRALMRKAQSTDASSA